MISAAASYARSMPGISVVLMALMVAFSIIAPGFATGANLANILSQASILLLIALPMTLIIMTEGLDLSMGAVLTLAAMTLALVATATASMVIAVLAALCVGTTFGVVNGCIVAIGRIPPFVATLGTMGVAQGLALVVTDGQIVVGIPADVRIAYSGSILGIPVPVLLAAVAYGATHALLYRSRFGGYVVALGGNREALMLAGLSVRSLLVSSYAITGIYVGLAALLMTARMNSGHPTAGIGMEFEAIAAVAIGGTSFARGNGTIFGTLVGVVTVGVLRNGLNLLGVASSLQVAAVGGLVIVSLLIDGFWSRRP
ncbi:MAG: ABC transporter permease [Hyphomicrobiaceae bacterium]|nr:MAG: ABC transporter permease [Hyphomicrobiaceae bacterium]